MEYKNTLLTGSTGQLGSAIMGSGYFKNLLSPSRSVLDITVPNSIGNFFEKNRIDSVIHCAALARMRECEENPAKALRTNAIGTSNLVLEALREEEKSGRKIRFVLISSDGVYPGIKGNYSETDAAIPYNKYGWTKLGSECAVSMLSDFCIIRASFFNPDDIRFKESADDAYSSKIQIKDLVKCISMLLNSDFVGTINVGGKKISDYVRYKKFKPGLRQCKLKDILKTVPFSMARDASMNIRLWNRLKKSSRQAENGKRNR